MTDTATAASKPAKGPPGGKRGKRTGLTDPNSPAMASQTRAEGILTALENEIIGGTLQPGSRLDEQALARRFKASRTPVREALKHLASSQLVTIRPRQGAVVATLSIPQLIEMFEVMAELEGLCAKLAARRIAAPEKNALSEAHAACRRMAEAGDPEGFYRENRRFHEIIYAASRNQFLRDTTQALRSRVGPYRHYVTYQPGRMAESIIEHEAVMQAILSGNGGEAQAMMQGHVNLLGDRFADFISVFSDRAVAPSGGPRKRSPKKR
jgi:DNA-binding GntR family transcriptional regulator